MFEHLRQVLRCAVLIAATFALFALGLAGLQVRQAIIETSTGTGASLTKVNTAIDHVDAMIGHLDEAAKQSAAVSRDTRINLVHLDRNQQRIARELSATLARVDAMVAHTDAGLNSASGVLPVLAGTIQRAGDDADVLTAEAVPVIQHADDLVNSAAVKQALSSASSTADYTRDSMKEVRDAIHDLRNPPKRTKGQRILDWIVRNIIGSAIQGSVRR